MLADAHPEQAMECRERELDHSTGGCGIGTLGGEVATRELRHRERPTHDAERLDERRGGADDDR
jgi:hypothetical protein